MRAHDHDHSRDEELRPKGARLDARESDAQLRAALSGRLDVATPDTVLRLQRAAGNAGAASLLTDAPPVHDVVVTGGQALDPGVRTDMESRLGHDFGDVRVHTDDRAHASAQAVNARAYTVGSHVVFQRSQYDPSSDAGRLTLAHELTHVVQQRNGPVDGSDAPGGIKVSDPSDRFEREAVATAERAVSGPAPVAPVASPAAAPAAVQRMEDDAAAPAVPTVQRAEAEEEKEEEKPA